MSKTCDVRAHYLIDSELARNSQVPFNVKDAAPIALPQLSNLLRARSRSPNMRSDTYLQLNYFMCIACLKPLVLILAEFEPTQRAVISFAIGRSTH